MFTLLTGVTGLLKECMLTITVHHLQTEPLAALYKENIRSRTVSGTPLCWLSTTCSVL